MNIKCMMECLKNIINVENILRTILFEFIPILFAFELNMEIIHN